MKNASTTHTVACRESVMFSVKDASRNVAKYWANEQAHGHTRCVFHDECGAELISTSGDVGHRTVHSSAGRLSRVRSTSAASGGEDGSACTSASGSGASAYASCGGCARQGLVSSETSSAMPAAQGSPPSSMKSGAKESFAAALRKSWSAAWSVSTSERTRAT